MKQQKGPSQVRLPLSACRSGMRIDVQDPASADTTMKVLRCKIIQYRTYCTVGIHLRKPTTKISLVIFVHAWTKSYHPTGVTEASQVGFEVGR